MSSRVERVRLWMCQAQDDLAVAKISEIGAVVDYLKALVALEQKKGTLLEKRNVVLEGLF